MPQKLGPKESLRHEAFYSSSLIHTQHADIYDPMKPYLESRSFFENQKARN